MALKGLVPELYCTDIVCSVTFYTQYLGFRILYERPEDKFAYLEREDSQIMLEQVDVGRKWISAELSFPFGRGMSFQIGIDAVQDLYDKLQHAGYKFFLPLEDKWYLKDDAYVGNRQFIIQDPDGYLLRFAQDLGTKSAQDVENTGLVP